jgi:hypothetical protein
LFEPLRDVAGPQFKVLGDVRVSARHDEVGFAILGKVFVDRHRARLTRLLRVGINGQVFVFDLDQSDRGLRRVLIFRRYGCDRLADVAYLALGEERLVLDGFTVRPGCVFAGNDRHDAGQ